MKLYLWDSVALKQYRNGDIIVVANNELEAREKALEYVHEYVRSSKSNYSYWFFSDGSVDEMFVEDYSDFMNKLELDLSRKCLIIDNGVIFINGSE